MAATKVIKKTSRENIIDAGVRLFSRQALADISIADVAREANCGHSLIYHYFSNVTELFDESISHIYKTFYPLIKAVSIVDQDPTLLFVGVISRFVNALKENKMHAYYYNLFTYNHPYSPFNKAVQSLQKDWSGLILMIIKKAQAAHVMIDTLLDEQIVKSLQITFRGIVASYIFIEDQEKFSIKPSTIYLPFLKGGN